MTKEEWLLSDDPTPMLDLVAGQASGRRLRLLGCAWCRSACRGAEDEILYLDTIDLIERSADGLERDEAVTTAVEAIAGIEDQIACAIASTATFNECELAGLESRPTDDRIEAIQQVGEDAAVSYALLKIQHLSSASEEYDSSYTEKAYEAVDFQFALLRDIFNPFHPVAFDPSWRTEAVVALARGMYESRDSTPMPVLADALEDAGCADADILAHCRGPGPHVRGCWVVDLVLGKN